MIKKLRKAFTIIELVIVIAVIAVLAAVMIPTFSNLIKKSNLSADMVAVRDMNTILATDEVLNDKPETIDEAKSVLSSNGVNDFTPMSANNEFYWLSSENRVILWNLEETKVTYPDELAKKFKDVISILKDWIRLDEYGFVEVTQKGEETIGEALNLAVQNAKDGAYIKLPENAEINIGMNAFYWGRSYLKKVGGIGKALTIDLNGGKLISNEEFIYNGDNYGYYAITVPSGGTLTLVNGEVDIKTDRDTYAALQVETGATLVLKDVTMQTNGAAIYPNGDASEVVIDNCAINGGAYALATNANYSNHISINITNSTLKADNAVIVNVPSYMKISDCELIGSGWGLIVRAGYAEVENSTIKTTDDNLGTNDSRYNKSCEYFVYNGDDDKVPYWGEGCQVPYGPLIVGDYSKTEKYNYDTECNLTNVIFENINTNKIPDIIVAAHLVGKNVVVNYDDETNVNRVVVFGKGYVRNSFVGLDETTEFGINHEFKHNGTITINENVETYTGSVSSPIIKKEIGNRYTIPEDAGTFKKYTYYNISSLNDEVLVAFKEHCAQNGLELTEAQWSTVKFAAGSTNNIIKTIIYDSSAE